MKRILFLGVILVMLTAAFTIPVAAATIYVPVIVGGSSISPLAASTGPQTYTVLVGWDNGQQNAMINAYFPSALTIHKGDTVKWVLNSMEFHTVTFLHGANISSVPFIEILPGLPPVLNPQAAFPSVPSGSNYDGSSFLNTGLMNPSGDPKNPTSFSLTFTATGTFDYLCLVHGTAMSGTIVVVNSSTPVMSPAQVSGLAKAELASFQPKIAAAIATAFSTEVAPVILDNGSTKYTVLVGYSDATGQVDLMNFFPNHVVAHPGDTIEWKLSPTNDAPHTVTFLNGNPDPALIIPLAGHLVINPAILIPVNVGGTLNHTDFFHSGFMDPTNPAMTPQSFTLKIGSQTGTFDYQCLLHDTSGMFGNVQVVLP